MSKQINIFNPSSEHLMLRETARKFAETRLEHGAAERDAQEYFDIKLFKELGDLGFLGICTPEEYGGSGMDAVAAVIVHEELAASDPGFTLAYLAHSMLCVNNIVHNADHEQKSLYLPKLCRGEWLGAMAMSEPEAGTDVFAISTKAHKIANCYVLNGRKMWITNGAQPGPVASAADVVFLYAKTGDGPRDLSSFIVRGDQPGFSVGQRLKGKLGMRASITAELVFDQCQLEINQLVGKEGEASLHMMRNLEIERLTLAAMSLGIARRSLVIMNRYANEREAFGEKIVNFGQIQKYLAESYAKFKACRSYIYQVASCAGQNQGRIDSDAVKLLASTCAKEIADAAIQVLGGYGYMGEYVVERLWRDAKLLEIGGGTLEAHQKNIANDLSRNERFIFS